MKTKLKLHLEKCGMKPEELAVRTGIPYSSLHNIINGYRPNTTLDRAMAIMDILEVKFEDIF